MPADSKFIPFHIPAIDEDEIQSVVETLKSGWLTTGPKVKASRRNLPGIWLQARGCGELRNRGSPHRIGRHRN